MDCKNKSVDVSLVHCTGKGVSLANIGHDPSAAPCDLISLVFSYSFFDKSNEILGKPRFRETNFF